MAKTPADAKLGAAGAQLMEFSQQMQPLRIAGRPW